MTACNNNSATALPEQSFPPDYSHAKSIEITIFGSTATGMSYVIKRGDDTMMWSREELLAEYEKAKPGMPYPYPNNPTFNNPDEYLFDALMDAIFADRVFSQTTPFDEADEVGRHSIRLYDSESKEIIAFDILYPNDEVHYIRHNGVFYLISDKIDSMPFEASFFMNR